MSLSGILLHGQAHSVNGQSGIEMRSKGKSVQHGATAVVSCEQFDADDYT